MIAIDPGKNGGIAWRYPSGIMGCCAMPKTEGDLKDALCRTWRSMADDWDVYLEAVHAMPGQGVTSMFTFGRNYGFILGVLMALGARVVLVQPRKWQQAIGITPAAKGAPKSAHKAKLKAEAQRLYPGMNVTLSTCDALLLLEYGRRQA